jgi:predicted transcriptional regulator
MKKAIPKTRGGRRPGSGRKPTGTDPARTVRLSDDFIARVDRWAKVHDVGRSEALRRLVDAGLKPHAFCLTDKTVAAINAWAKENEPGLSQADAIAKLIEIGLKGK